MTTVEFALSKGVMILLVVGAIWAFFKYIKE
jgi:hypothetical protein